MLRFIDYYSLIIQKCIEKCSVFCYNTVVPLLIPYMRRRRKRRFIEKRNIFIGSGKTYCNAVNSLIINLD